MEKLLSMTKQIIKTILGEQSLSGSMNSTHPSQMDLISIIWHSFNIFIFSGLNHYIYSSTLISIVILRILITSLNTFIVIIIVIIIAIVTFTYSTILFIYLFIYLFTYLFIYLFNLFIHLFIYLLFYSFIYLIRGPIRPEGSIIGNFFNTGMLRVEEESYHSDILDRCTSGNILSIF